MVKRDILYFVFYSSWKVIDIFLIVWNIRGFKGVRVKNYFLLIRKFEFVFKY